MEQTQASRAGLELALKRTVVAGMETLIETVSFPAEVMEKLTAATIALETEIRIEDAKADGWQ